MNWYSIFYWLTVADGIKDFFDTVSNWTLFFTIVFFVLYWVAFGIYHDSRMKDDEENDKQAKYWFKIIRSTFFFFFTIMLVTWTAYVLIPSKKDALIIIAGGAVGNFITTDTSARQVPAEVMNLLRAKIKEEIASTSINGVKDTLESLTKEQLIEQLHKKGTE